MIQTLFGIKKGMISGYDTKGRRVGATIVEVKPHVIAQLKTLETKDGYNAVQLALGTKKHIKKPLQGILKKAGIEKAAVLREVRTDETADLSVGQEIKVNTIFRKGDLVKVTGTSKGKGFQGGVRRHGFHGGPKTHGQSDRHRAPGSIGAGTTPGWVYKGKRMAGHMGVDTVSYTGLEILAVDKELGLITIKGGIPGATGALIRIEKQGIVKGYTPEVEEEEVVEEQNGGESENQNVGEAENTAPIESESEQSESSESSDSSDQSDSAEPSETPVEEKEEENK